MWRFLWENNSFHKSRFEELGLSRESVSSVADIGKLPLMTKAEIRHNVDLIISNNVKKSDLLHFKTGGSTGKALDIYLTEECSEFRNACARRHDMWSSWNPGEPIGAVWGNPKLPHDLKSRILNTFVQPMIYLDTMSVSEDSVLEFAKEWKCKRPTLLYGHAHSIYTLAQYVDKLAIDCINPAGILSTSMMLLPHERAVIERVFGVKVVDRYGCEEVSLVGCECEKHEGMHMNIEHLVIEFLRDDGSHAKPGEPGKIVVTDLMNYAMPLVRYCVEDVGVYMDSQCSCGRGLPLMGKVSGRVADFLIKRDGSRVAGVSLIENTLTKVAGIDQMQIIQDSLDLIHLNIVVGSGFQPQSVSFLTDYFQQIFGREVNVRVDTVKEIHPERSGKYRFSICKINQ